MVVGRRIEVICPHDWHDLRLSLERTWIAVGVGALVACGVPVISAECAGHPTDSFKDLRRVIGTGCFPSVVAFAKKYFAEFESSRVVAFV
jgi:hypothetical protein